MNLLGLFSNTVSTIFAPLSSFVEPLFGTVDTYPDESHGITVDTTDKPIETGARLTDHAIVRPDTLTLEGYVSDVQVFEGTLTNLTGGDRGPEAFGRIETLMKAREPVRVITAFKTYPSMMILTFNADRNVDTGQALHFTMTLREIEFANTQLLGIAATQVDREGPAANKTSTIEGGRKQSLFDTQTDDRLLALANTAGFR